MCPREWTGSIPVSCAAVCDHIGNDLSDEILNFYDHASVRSNPAYFKGLHKMHGNSIGKRRMLENREHVDELLSYPGAMELLKEFNYL